MTIQKLPAMSSSAPVPGIELLTLVDLVILFLYIYKNNVYIDKSFPPGRYWPAPCCAPSPAFVQWNFTLHHYCNFLFIEYLQFFIRAKMFWRPPVYKDHLIRTTFCRTTLVYFPCYQTCTKRPPLSNNVLLVPRVVFKASLSLRLHCTSQSKACIKAFSVPVTCNTSI